MIHILNYQGFIDLPELSNRIDGEAESIKQNNSSKKPDGPTSSRQENKNGVDIEAIFHSRLTRQLKPAKRQTPAD